jgi:tetratricopeptide (TPR) repeat protein
MNRGDVVAGRFRIEGPVGRGGMGTVYRAHDEVSAQPVALKVLRDDVPQAVERFSREIAALGRLSHPSVVRYVAHGSDPPFVAMEWLEGEDLARRLRSGRLSVREAVDLGVRLADALEHVHALGIVHRDIKPGNLFFEHCDLERLRVVDFGLAAVRDDDSFRTAAGLMLGTPGYMAPEQARGQAADARADVFAVACVIYKCLTGRGPFAGSDPVATLAKLLIDDPVPASSLRPETPRALDQLLARALSKDPDGRPPTARAFGDELARIDTSAPAPRDHSPTVTAPAASSTSLSARERRILSVVVAALRPLGADGSAIRCEVDAAFLESQPVLRAIAARHGARLEASPAAIVALLEGRGSATDRAAAAARLAVDLRGALGGLAVALVTGRAEVTQRSVGDAIDRAVAQVTGEQHGADGVWIDETTAGLLGPQFVVRAGSGGIELLGEKSADLRVRTLLGKPTPCVGRDKELAFLDATLAECEADELARGVLVTAPAGAGKSRLAYEWLRKLAAREPKPDIWTARADPIAAGAPLSLLAQLVRGAVGLDPSEPADAARARLRARVSRHVSSDEQVQRIAEFLGEIVGVRFPGEGRVQLKAARRDASLMSDQMRRAWEDWVGAEADAGGVVVVLEDLHWGDLPTLQFVSWALGAHADRRLMVVALARPEVKEVFPMLAQTRQLLELPLGDLTTKASARLARHVLGEGASADTIERVVARSAGNAFFLEEILRAVAEGRGEDVPETVLAMVQRRLDALEPDARRVLRAASAYGETFWRGAVVAAAGAGSGTLARVDPWLDELERRELVFARAGSRFAGERELAFHHAIVREAAYAMLTPEDRTLAHRLAGTWLEEHGETDSAVVAGHFDRGDDRERAVVHYARAAAQAIEASDLVKLLEHTERAVELGASGATLGELRRLEAEALRWRGRVAESEKRAREAAELLPPRTPSWYTAVAELGASAGLLAHLDVLAEAHAILVERGDPSQADYAMTLSRITTPLYIAGERELADAAMDRIDSFDTSDVGPLVLARIEQARALQALDYSIHFEHMKKVRALFETAGDRRNACVQAANLGYVAVSLGALDEAEQLLVPALEVAEDLGIVRIVAIFRQNIGLLRHYQGRNAEAIELERESVAALDAQGDHRLAAASLVYLSMALAASGEIDQAFDAARRAVELAEAMPPMHATTLAHLADLELARGAHTDALDRAREAYAIMERLGGLEDRESLVRAVYAEALLVTGRDGDARRVASDSVAALEQRAARIALEARRESFRKAADNARVYAVAARLRVA